MDGPIIESSSIQQTPFKSYSIFSKIILLVLCCISCYAGFSQNTSYSVPVVFHIIGNNSSLITDQQIQDAVQDLNNAFAHSGNYAAGNGANTRISFCLARINPDGGNSSGITRTQSVLGDFDSDIENDRLKKLSSWNSKAYCNIWVVDGVKNEYFTTFSCGNWSRKHNRGYSNFSPDGEYQDGIVTYEFGSVLAMLMGNYLGLKFSFELGSCTNNNCDTDGDGICDTPPASAPGNSCQGYQNTCNTDTVSGFTKNMPDLDSNFMSFSGPCTNSFTEGQAAKMRKTLSETRKSLFDQNKCNPPCRENITAAFTRNNWFPAPGDLIQFTGTSTGGTNYQWSVNSLPVGGNSPNYSQSFTQAGKYKVMLKVYNTDQACYASYSDSVIVGCGVMARFYPDKRVIASKDQIINDSILFTNRSVNATGYQWWISNNTGMTPQIISTRFNLNYIFPSPGLYAVWLVASNGNCSDTTEKFNFNVFDPTVDATISLENVECYEQTKIKVAMRICNQGYAPMPAGTPITFYDGDPHSDTAKKLGSVFSLPSPVPGKCCNGFSTILDIGKPGLNRLYAVINDNGTTKPLVLPNTSLPEAAFTNNITTVSNFQFQVTASPPSATLEQGDTLQLSASAGPGTVSSYLWSPSKGLNCTDCPNPFFIAGEKVDLTEKVIATSQYGCLDSAYVKIKVPSADDYVITIDSMACAGNNNISAAFTIYNQFKHGIVPNGLKISFYEGNPSTDTAHLLQPVYTLKTENHAARVSATNLIAGIREGSFYAVVNDSGITAPVNLPADSLFPEKDYMNNTASFYYQSEQIILQPADTTIYRKQSFPISIRSNISAGSEITWDPGPGYSLSCSNCLSPVVTGFSDSYLTMHTDNPHGCHLEGKTHIKIFPPDFTAEILETHCYTNDSTLVKFNICVNNGYDSIFAGLPVSFYDGDWRNGQGKLLSPTYYTNRMAGNCDSFSAIIKMPASENLSIVVNDKGQNNSTVPDSVYSETEFSNNSNTIAVVPFSVSINPRDTTINRSNQVILHTQVTGGKLSSFNWEPVEFLSCSTCLEPVVSPAHSEQYKLEVQNEYTCTAKAYAQIKTFTGGKVNIPNAFTPNGDGRNDVFYIMGNQDIKVIKSFSVFNRWGQAVFSENNVQPNDPRFGWTGLSNGQPSAAETYVYVAVIEFTDGTEQVFKGSVLLIL